MTVGCGGFAPPAASPERGALPPALKTCDFQRSPQGIFTKKKEAVV
jgi:hypothetical protein